MICITQHCDTYDIVANCNIMLTNKVFTQVPWILMYSSFTVFWILIQKVLIRLLPYLTYKFNMNERVDVSQDGP